ncbi:di-heme oxidoredictase family protein [Cellvibrio japonicus]|nr:di-heme oxidoredictase family protein [Cellvibrio japonicus]
MAGNDFNNNPLINPSLVVFSPANVFAQSGGGYSSILNLVDTEITLHQARICSVSGGFMQSKPDTRLARALLVVCLSLPLMLLSGVSQAQTNVAVNKPVAASSALQPAGNAVDGNAASRWESTHGETPSWISVDLGAVYSLSRTEIDWEAANAANYEVQGSLDGSQWTRLAIEVGGSFGNRTDQHVLAGNYRFLRIYCTQRSSGNLWGYSIFEWRVQGSLLASSASSALALPLPVAQVTASSQLQPAANALDNNPATRWETNHGAGPAWIAVDLGAAHSLTRAVIDWEAANAADYQLQGSQDNSQWVNLTTRTGAAFGNRTDTLDISGSYRYLRIYATQRSAGNSWGYSIFEWKIYGSAISASSSSRSSQVSSSAISSSLVSSSRSSQSSSRSSSSVVSSQPTALQYQPLFATQFPAGEARNWRIEPDGTIVTYGSGRARSRHEAEDIFYTFPAFYHEHRTFHFEIHDHTPKGESRVDIYYEPEYANFNDIGCRKSLFNPYRSYFGDNGGFTRIRAADAATGKGERWHCVGTRFVPTEREGLTRLRAGDFYDFEFQQWLGFTETDPRVSAQRVYYTDTFRIKLGSPGLYIVNNDALNGKLASGGSATAAPVRAYVGVAQADVISTTGTLVDSGSQGYMAIRSPQAIAKGYQIPGYQVNTPANNATVTYRHNGQTYTDQVLDYAPGAASPFIVDRASYDWTSFFREALNIRWETHNQFLNGRRIFHTDFVNGSHFEPGNPDFPALANLATGLTINSSCVGCHINNGRGPAPVAGNLGNTLAVKVSSGQLDALGNPAPHGYFGKVLQPRSRAGSVPAEGNLQLSYTSVSGTYNDGSRYELQAPQYQPHIQDTQGGTLDFFSARMPQTIVGLGLLEAVPEAQLLARHDPQDADGDGISGRAALVRDMRTGESRIGRFGWKASVASLEEFTADALHEDIGVGTSILPGSACGQVQTACRANSNNAVELNDERLKLLTVYMQALGAPARRAETVNNADVQRGEQRFRDFGCAACHTPELTTDHAHPLAELRGQTIRPYTDLLLHDMGEGLADRLSQDAATNREWRTPPLWGLGLTQAVNGHTRLLHDGRARNIEEAILWHGGEAAASQAAFRAATAAQRNDLVKFLESL